MTDEFDDDDLDLIPHDAEIWPNLPDVPIEQRRRAWCLATSLESLPQTGKATEIAKAAVTAAGVFEEYILGNKPGLKLVKSE